MPRMKQISIDVDVDKAIYARRLTLAESENDILRRMLLPSSPPKQQARADLVVHPKESKRRGSWSVQLLGEEHKVANMKDAYCTLLRLLADLDAKFLSKYSAHGTTSRKYVARSAEGLFMSSPHLATDFATLLVDGWFVDTNVSKGQVAKRVRAAADTVGLRYGVDVKATESGRTI